MSSPTCFRGLADRNREHLAHVVHTTVDPLRKRLVMTMISVVRMVVSRIRMCIISFLLEGRHRLSRGMCDLLHGLGMGVIGSMVFLPIRIRIIGFNSIIRGDREHLSQMMEAVADPLGHSFLVMLASGHVSVSLVWTLWRGAFVDLQSVTKQTNLIKPNGANGARPRNYNKLKTIGGRRNTSCRVGLGLKTHRKALPNPA
jgi:hypothetical protein